MVVKRWHVILYVVCVVAALYFMNKYEATLSDAAQLAVNCPN
jgi:hypothetical protein